MLVKRPIERGDAATLARDLATTTADGFLIEPDSPATFAWFATEVAPLVDAPPSRRHPARPLRPRPSGEPVRVVKQIHLAAHFPGVNNTTVWSDPDSGSQTDFSSFVHLAQTRRAREVRLLLPRRGPPTARAPRPDLRSRRRRPSRLAHGARRARSRHRPRRARGHAEHHVQRALRARPPVRDPRPSQQRPRRVERGDLARRVHRRELPPCRLPRLATTATSAPPSSSRWPASCGTRTAPGSRTTATSSTSRGRSTRRCSPQGYPVMIQAGDSDGGRELAAKHADVIFTRHSGLRRRPGVLRRREAAAREVRAQPATT